jgi:hypothetical protein
MFSNLSPSTVSIKGRRAWPAQECCLSQPRAPATVFGAGFIGGWLIRSIHERGVHEVEMLPGPLHLVPLLESPRLGFLSMPFSAIRLLSAALFGLLASPISFSIPAGNTSQNALGRVVFPTSCAAGVQSVLTTGDALLHSFQYMEARKTFADAAQRDQRCAMAFWGQAMSLYHQLWDFPQSESLQEGLARLPANGK